MTPKHEDESGNQTAPPDHGRRQFLKGVGIAGAGAAIADKIFAKEEAGTSAETTGLMPAGSTMPLALDVNGMKRTVEVEPRTTLLSALRDHLEPPVTGAKLVCGAGTCGACTVLLDGKPVYSCLVFAMDASGQRITTAEGLGNQAQMNQVQASFVEHDAVMCGFCTPGFVTSISAYLKRNPNPSLDEVREACKGNFCRCGTYPKVFEAALAIAQASRRAALETEAESEVA